MWSIQVILDQNMSKESFQRLQSIISLKLLLDALFSMLIEYEVLQENNQNKELLRFFWKSQT